MNDDTGRGRKPRAGVLAAAAGIALLIAACGGSPSGAGSTGHQTACQRELACAQCMRAHGDPGFPDPQSDGTFNETPANAGDFSGPQAQSANGACAHLAGREVSPVRFQLVAGDALKFAGCMRSHGIPSFPEPEIDWGKLERRITSGASSPNSPQFLSAQRACQPLLKPTFKGGGGGS